MDRDKLERTLAVCAPGLAPAMSPIKHLHNFLFLGDRVVAFNGTVMIRCMFASGIRGGVEGRYLQQLLDSTAGAIDLVQQGSAVKFKAGKHKASLAVWPVEDYSAHPMEALAPWKATPMTDPQRAIFDLFEDCLRVCSEDGGRPAHHGVSMIPAKGKRLDLYGTNGVQLVWASTPDQFGLEDRIIVPAEFCRQAVKLNRDAEKLCLRIDQERAMLMADDVIVMATLLDKGAELQFDKVIAANPAEGLAEMTDDLVAALRIASYTTDGGGSTLLEIAGGKAKVSASAAAGSRDAASGITMAGHPDIKVRVVAGQLVTASEHHRKIRVHELATLLVNDRSSHLISHYGE